MCAQSQHVVVSHRNFSKALHPTQLLQLQHMVMTAVAVTLLVVTGVGSLNCLSSPESCLTIVWIVTTILVTGVGSLKCLLTMGVQPTQLLWLQHIVAARRDPTIRVQVSQLLQSQQVVASHQDLSTGSALHS